jgi:Cu(I)/Ag(I) efflux system protein CusF
MKTMVRSLARMLSVLIIFAASAAAQEKAVEPVVPALSSATEMSDGEVRKIDKDSGKVTIRHGELKNLDMPPMTMVFQVKEPALLAKIKVGDKIRFRAEKAGSAFVIIDVHRTEP